MNSLRRRFDGVPGLSLPAVAVVVILGLVMAGGGAFAASQITSGQIKNETIKSKDVKNNNLKGIDIKDGSLTSADILNGTITGDDVLDGSLTTGDVLDGTLTTDDVLDESLTGTDVLNNSIASADVSPLDGDLDIVDNTITTFDIATDAIDSDEVLDFGLSNQDIGVLYAEVNDDGTLASSSGSVTSSRISAGQYEVDFGRNINACAKFGNLGSSTTASAPGEVSVVDRASVANAVFAATYTSAGAAADRDFKILVVC
jgi:hypothetical protein